MSNEITESEMYLQQAFYSPTDRTVIKHYGNLRAKEAVKEFAEELMEKAVFYDSNFKVVTTKKIQKLAKQKGVEI